MVLNENPLFSSTRSVAASLKSQWPHQTCIINTAGKKEWWILVRSTLAIFSHSSSSGTHLKGLASPTRAQLSSSAQLRCNNPNSHSQQFPHLCLHSHLPYVHYHLWRCFFPTSKITQTWPHAAGWAGGIRRHTSALVYSIMGLLLDNFILLL